jgi:hypothetical protein
MRCKGWRATSYWPASDPKFVESEDGPGTNKLAAPEGQFGFMLSQYVKGTDCIPAICGKEGK